MESSQVTRIFTFDQLNNLTTDNFNSLKSEILLEFQLTDDITINLNGHEVNKNEVLIIFDHLMKKLNFHTNWYHNYLTDEFFKSGNASYLFNKGNHIINLLLNNSTLTEELIKKVSNIVLFCLKSDYEDRLAHIKKLTEITEKLPKQLRQRIFAPSINFLKIGIDSATKNHKSPFANHLKLHFKDTLRAAVDRRITEIILSFPSQYHYLAYEYAHWCQNSIIKVSNIRESEYCYYPINSLLILRDAALIASQFYDSDKNIEIADTISELLKNPKQLARKRHQNQEQNKMGTTPLNSVLVYLTIVTIVLLLLWSYADTLLG